MRGNPLLARLLMGVAVLMMLVPTFLYLAGPLRRPLMLDGDRIEQRSCPDCQGTGKKDGSGCIRCRTAGVIDYLLPGPNRPTEIVGHLYAPDGTQVPSAEVEVSTSAGARQLRSDEKGQFGIALPPGTYALKVTSERGKLQEQVVVETLTAPAPADRDLAFPRQDRSFTLK